MKVNYVRLCGHIEKVPCSLAFEKAAAHLVGGSTQLCSVMEKTIHPSCFHSVEAPCWMAGWGGWVGWTETFQQTIAFAKLKEEGLVLGKLFNADESLSLHKIPNEKMSKYLRSLECRSSLQYQLHDCGHSKVWIS